MVNMSDHSSSFHGLEEPAEASTSRATVPPAGESLTARHKRLKKERDDLLKQIETRKLEAEIRILQRQVDGDPDPTNDESSTAETQENASGISKRRRPDDEGTDGPPSSRRDSSAGGIRTVKPDPYDGKSRQALKEYTRQCEYTFRLAPDRYARDSTKVLYAAQFLYGETAK